MCVKRFLFVLATVGLATSAARALPLITSITENGTAVPTMPGSIVTSNTNPSPSGFSTSIFDEAFIYTDRSHEFTIPRTDAAGTLNTAGTSTARLFPYYLNGAEYINFANADRGIADY